MRNIMGNGLGTVALIQKENSVPKQSLTVNSAYRHIKGPCPNSLSGRGWLLPLTLLGALLLAGCEPDPNVRAAKEEGQTGYSFNGEIEGCRLYRVKPRFGTDFQLAICGPVARTSWTEGCGKGCSRTVEMQSIWRDAEWKR